MRCSLIKMATNGLGFTSPCALKLTLNFIVVGIATNVNAGSYDYVNAKQLHKNDGVSEDKKNAEWLLDFDFTQPKKSTKSRKRIQSKSNDTADKKLKWQKQMEKISLREREKWKKYREENPESLITTETSDDTLMKNNDNQIGNNLTNGKDSFNENYTSQNINDKNIFHSFKEVPGDDKISANDNGYDNGNDNDQDFPRSLGMQNGRWMLHEKHNSESDLAEEIGENKKSKIIGDDFSNGIRFSGSDNQSRSSELEMMKLGNQSKMIENGRWGLTDGGDNLLSDIKRMIENNDEILARRFLEEDRDNLEKSKETEEEKEKEEEEEEQDIWKGRWGMSEIEPPEKFLNDVLGNENIDSIEEEEEEEENYGKHSNRLKSAHEKLGKRKEAISMSDNEYWMNDGSFPDEKRIEEDASGNSRRTLNIKEEEVEKEEEEEKDDEKNSKNLKIKIDKSEKFPESNLHSGIPKLIQIIISPYNTAVRNDIELSIDRLIPIKKNEIPFPPLPPSSSSSSYSNFMEIQPIVIELLAKVCDKN